MPRLSILRSIGGLGALGLGARLVRRGLDTQKKIDTVSGELRHPALRAGIDIANTVQLRIARSLPTPPQQLADGVTISDRTVQGGDASVNVRVYEPDGVAHGEGAVGALLWIHGGGLILGRPEQDDGSLTHLANELGIVVVAARYRLAPEHPYPAAIDDCVGALRWMHEQADSLGIDAARIAVGGASAGGGLAAAVALRARDDEALAVCAQILIYPMLDDRTTLRTDHQGRGEFMWRPKSNRFGWTSYLGLAPSAVHDKVDAVPGRAIDLTGVAPAWIGVGDLDLFYDEDVDYAERLRSAGVDCELEVIDGMYHAADVMRPDAPSMVTFRQSWVDALGRAVGADS